MGTPFISFQGPASLDDYKSGVPSSQQPSTIPKVFKDAMEVREKVFVEEQGVQLSNEFDSDDARSCHWVIYASVNTPTQPQQTDAEGKITQRKQSITETVPIGTIRLVPFPHEPHPEPGSVYTFDATTSSVPKFTIDRPTTYHDGKEPYLKLGRLAVIPEFRGHKLAGLLVNAAVAWAQQNPTAFNPSVAEVGMDQLGAETIGDIPVWKGLICAHAQEQVVKVWERWGFNVDEGMGTWYEEGIKHVGMFQRLKFEDKLL
ncbi:acyl-CoA N-acyltransferase (Nat)-1 [Coleophoma crateriformis]|uniref:Acyl-CoA N-acyltransferase (Nat)-1 n=1 Tax=Coleophoma crateriformis TaxID=565419 RepID=A0A3D8T7H0_9HELO|nr:acyl-CoA N-acyltransferase (Nat)-1 [Coleophoma crateriformis]